ncbi:hypothetical protein EPA93_17330 [Ktedonosporobacter rubrisoli]|uniref:Uncharacterized protein n=1 Tax=Ktedonosporobacter rubrisoli TaxID=2509675 RepID=A0A4P6JR42_KTERU|nr:hypothetical protein [Ktedonosporobacter rubrisoli]QBD77660.1 hypothetical protein EPA93_17330 [Ktedonosporobacter rubrisoli]
MCIVIPEGVAERDHLPEWIVILASLHPLLVQVITGLCLTYSAHQMPQVDTLKTRQICLAPLLRRGDAGARPERGPHGARLS